MTVDRRERRHRALPIGSLPQTGERLSVEPFPGRERIGRGAAHYARERHLEVVDQAGAHELTGDPVAEIVVDLIDREAVQQHPTPVL